jgi:hypothetical protein
VLHRVTGVGEHVEEARARRRFLAREPSGPLDRRNASVKASRPIRKKKEEL